jgi:hypothetical protein
MAVTTQLNTGTTPLPVTNGGSGLASTVAYAPLCGGTSTTSALQSVASVGTSGQYLTSNGAAALPTYQVFPLGASPITYTKVTLAPSDITGMFATPKLLISNAGAHTLIQPFSVVLEVAFNTTAYTGGGTTFIQWGSTIHGAGSQAGGVMGTANFNVLASGFTLSTVRVSLGTLTSNNVNTSLYLSNQTGAYATGDSTCYLHIYYYVLSTTV